MKKSLLFAASALLALPTFAGVDPATYDDADGLKIKNLWMVGRNLDLTEFNASELAEFNNKTRTCVVAGDEFIVAKSKTKTVDDNSDDYATLVVYDLFSGAHKRTVEITVDGKPISGTLAANNIGLDDFGNVWVAPIWFNANKTAQTVYWIKDLTTGVAEVAFQVALPEDEVTEAARRVDYCDLVGDVTGKQAGTVFMAPVANDETCSVLGWERAQGESEFTPHMCDGEYYVQTMEETYPADQTTWNGAPGIRIIRDEDHSGSLFYIDAFVTSPALYDTSGGMLDGFMNADKELCPTASINGINEFSIGGNDYIVYTWRSYDKDPGCQVKIAKLGTDMSFEGLEGRWELPANGFGLISDTGTRAFGMCPVKRVDSKGNEAVYLGLMKCNNGMGVYRIAGPDFQAGEFEAGVNDIVIDNQNAPVEYFNLNGVSVAADNLTPGLYIARQGSKVEKVRK